VVIFAVPSPGTPASLGAEGEADPSVGTGAGATVRGTTGCAGVAVGGAAAAGMGIVVPRPAFGEGTALGAGTTGAPGFGITADPAATGAFGAPGFGITGADTGAFKALALGAS
jgi:hypothetical protein